MRFLAIDYGSKNIGLARASTDVDVIVPFGKVANEPAGFGQKKLAEIIKTEKIDKLVVGLPLGFDGGENKNTERIRQFAGSLQAETGVPVDFVTEIFSSQAGDRMGAGVSRDEKAAMVILQGYLAKKV